MYLITDTNVHREPMTFASHLHLHVKCQRILNTYNVPGTVMAKWQAVVRQASVPTSASTTHKETVYSTLSE